MDNILPSISVSTSFTQYDYDAPPSYVDFHAKLRELTVVPEPLKDKNNRRGKWKGRPFVRVGALIAWLGEPSLPNPSACNVEMLLEMVYDQKQPLLISHEDMLHGDKRCSLMFCILLELGCGNLVSNFYHHGIHDKSLPRSRDQLRDLIDVATESWSDEAIDRLADNFNEKQWKYYPLQFSHATRPLPLDKEWIIPICQQSPINEKGGSSAELHMIAIPEDFIDPKLRNTIHSSGFDHPEFGKCYQLALKSFDSHCQRLFEAEIAAYHHLQNQPHVIKCFGGFTHWGKGADTRVHSILLEYGECDLGEYFGLVDPPVIPEDVELFWSKLFRVVTAIRDIHSFKSTRAGNVVMYDGWHGDIKPDNILMIERQLKLADPGFVNFVLNTSSQNENGVPQRLKGWTSTYGPPEVNEKQFAVHEPWAVDMWSLGCVLSEAATWVVFGNSGRFAYSNLRQEAIKTLENATLGDGDFFHNGQDVLTAVTQWHWLLRSHVRSSDKITKQVLDFVDKYLLLQKPSKRMTADELYQKFAKVQESAERSRLQTGTPMQFMGLIRKARAQPLESYIAVSQILDGLSVEERKTNNPAKSAIFNKIFRNPDAANYSRMNPRESTMSRASISNPFGSSAPLNSQFGSPHYSDKSIRPLHRSSTSMLSVEPLKTIFAAYYERKVEEAKVGDKLFHQSRKKKDKILSSYYKNRDIVFLVDNGTSMAQYWPEVKFTLTELVGKARNLDEDGMDLFFTRSDKSVRGAKRDALQHFEKALESKSVVPEAGMFTNMAATLEAILYDWLRSYKRGHNPDRRMTIIILTDGRWPNMSNSEDGEYDVDRTIITWCQEATKLGVFKHKPLFHQMRPVSIQFVSFGQDAVAQARLQRLDDRLQTHEAAHDLEDIIDTEPSTGSIYKMLLGSFNPDYDELQTAESSGNNSLSQSTSQLSSPNATSTQWGSIGTSSSDTNRSQSSTPAAGMSTHTTQSYSTLPQVPRPTDSQRTSRLSGYGSLRFSRTPR